MTTNSLKGKLTTKQSLTSKLNNKEIYIYPELEELTVTPGIEEQKYKGAYGEVNIQGVTSDIDEDIKPENIKAGVNILGVNGGYEGIDTSDDSYDELEYITFTDGQVIDSGVPIWNSTNWTILAKIKLAKLSGYQTVFFSAHDDNYHETYVDSSGKYYTKFRANTTTAVSVATGLTAGTECTIKHVYDGTSCYTYINNILRNTTPTSCPTTTNTLKFGCKGTSFFKGDLMKIELYRGDELVFDAIPVIRKKDNEACMYDTISGTFLRNGIGKIEAGPLTDET